MELLSKPHRYLLFLRFLLVNLVAVALLGAVFLQGWLNGIFVPITLEMSFGILPSSCTAFPPVASKCGVPASN